MWMVLGSGEADILIASSVDVGRSKKVGDPCSKVTLMVTMQVELQIWW